MTGGGNSMMDSKNQDYISKIEALSQIINECENEDVAWLKNTES
jgi:hypothetical protein